MDPERLALAEAKVNRLDNMIIEREIELEELKSQFADQQAGGSGVAVVNNTTSTAKNNIVPLATSPRPGSKGSPLERHIGQSTVY